MPRPEVDVPRAMAGAIITGLVSAFAFLLALLFCVTSFDEVNASVTWCTMSVTNVLADRQQSHRRPCPGYILPGNHK